MQLDAQYLFFVCKLLTKLPDKPPIRLFLFRHNDTAAGNMLRAGHMDRHHVH